jgi:hypothetical protein
MAVLKARIDKTSVMLVKPLVNELAELQIQVTSELVKREISRE